MTEKILELFKYPVTIVTLLIAVLVAKAAGVTEISLPGGGGAKFDQQAQASVAALDSKLNAAIQDLQALRREKAGETKPTKETEEKVFTAAQTVSDQTAQFAKLNRSEAKAPRTGFIWIGNYRGAWNPVELSTSSGGDAITTPPDRLQAGEEYYVRGNMVIRDGLPGNDETYYRGRQVIGTVTRGAKVKLLATPTGLDREFAVQYWVQVEAQ
jgi:hypothetical protein